MTRLDLMGKKRSVQRGEQFAVFANALVALTAKPWLRAH